jgi:DNA mismatch endonuclease (patch repair protein)
MSRIKSRGSKAEQGMIDLLKSRRYTFSYQRNDLPGQPDFVFPRRKKIIFVNGCFWHQHKGCKRATMPHSNRSYWKEKLAGNIKRDRSNTRKLRYGGWSIMTVWECESKLSNLKKLERRVKRFLA